MSTFETDQTAPEPVVLSSPDHLTLYLVRHGETLFNQRSVVQGWTDSPLTPLGREQAAHMSRELSSLAFNAAYSSISERAIDTAEAIVGDRDLTVVYDRGLKELNFGIYEGLPNHDLWSRIPADLPPEEVFASMVGPNAPGLEGGETGQEFSSRLVGAINRIRNNHELGAHILVVSHGAAIGALLSALNLTVPGPLDNASLTVLTFDAEGNPAVPLYGVTTIPDHVVLPSPANAEGAVL